MHPDRDTFERALLAWVNQRFAPDGPAIARETPLFAGGLINSIRILELIAWTERALGRRIPDASIRMDYFRTVAAIAATFVPERTHAPR